MKKRLAILLCCVLVFSVLAGCSSGAPSSNSGNTTGDTPAVSGNSGSNEPPKTYKLRIAANNAMIINNVNYICEQKGWFEEAGLEIERLGFESGPVQMEAIDSWDVAVTGIGGVLVGTISNDTPVIAAIQWDCATHFLWVRPDSPIVAAGTGSNKYSDKIYGDADTWRNATVLCPSGNTLNYLLAKTLDGFGLTTDDIDWVVMDAPSANTAFQGGEGDVAATWAGLSFTEDKNDYIAVSNGLDVQTNVMCNIVANPDSYADEETREAIKIYLRVFMEASDWVNNNIEEAANYLMELFEDDGQPIDYDTAVYMLKADYAFGLELCHEMMNEKSDEGDYSKMDENILGVLNYYISVGNYAEGDDAKYLGHCDPTLINEIYEEINS